MLMTLTEAATMTTTWILHSKTHTLDDQVTSLHPSLSYRNDERLAFYCADDVFMLIVGWAEWLSVEWTDICQYIHRLR